MFLNLSEEVQREDRLVAMDLKTGLTTVASEFKTAETNLTKQNILISRFRYHLGLLMGPRDR